MDAKLHIITLLGFKGGAGRTTSAAALAYGLASLGYHVALIDAGHAVPLQERVLSESRGRGAPPEESLLFKWADCLPPDAILDGHNQYIRATTTAYLGAVIDQLRLEGWDYAIIDTPAHQTAAVFEAAGQSSLLIVPARTSSDAIVVREALPAEFMDRHHTLRCLVAGTDRPSDVRNAFAPLTVLRTELPHDTASTSVVPISASSGEWQICCSRLAREVAELAAPREQINFPTQVGLFAT
ncbi:cellulose synthase operon protein YhjQ/BcsQ [Aliiroseovarius sp. 2305UL8-7]|uniref:nucleotide-binding protein n=1 Tax=Aliiroseovarius conchicola TaxID=3121637 RepID=UPI003529D19D